MNYQESLKTGQVVIRSIFQRSGKRATLQVQQEINAPVSEGGNPLLSLLLENSNGNGNGKTKPTALVTADASKLAEFLTKAGFPTEAAAVTKGKDIDFTKLDKGVTISEFFGQPMDVTILVVENTVKNPFSQSHEPKTIQREGEDLMCFNDGKPIYRHTAVVKTGSTSIVLGKDKTNKNVVAVADANAVEVGGNFFLSTTDFLTLEEAAETIAQLENMGQMETTY